MINENLNKFFSKFGLNKHVVERIVYFLVLIVFLIFSIHAIGCIWAYIGFVTSGSWLDEYGISRNEQKEIYVKSIYWVITTLTTVGYGDIVGFTYNEYIYQMIVEFIGIAFFSFFIGSINNILVQESKL